MATRKVDGSAPDSDREPRYDDELLAANWNPVVELLSQSCSLTRERATHDARADLTDTDADGFLNRVYTLGA